MRIVLLFLTFFTALYSSQLNNLLQQYKDSSKNSLKTLDEKMGHVVVYTQDQIDLMQYETLSDILREIPMNNFGKNRFGLNTLSLSGNKTEVTGFFRLYINDHEVSSIYNGSPSTHWLNMPISLIDRIEVYYGEGSFTLGNTTGIQFIRVYTKDPKKENGDLFETSISNNSANMQSYTHANVLQNGWQYLFHLSNHNSFNSHPYKGEKILDDVKRQYFFANFQNSKNSIDIGYSKLIKDNYFGYAKDLTPDDGEIDSQNYFLHMTNYFLQDNSLKTSLSIDKTDHKYSESHNGGMYIVPILDLTNPPLSIPQTMPKKFNEEVGLTKLNAYISKEFKVDDHTLFTALNFKNKKYDTKQRSYTNLFNTSIDEGQYNDYDEETIYSFMFQDDYKVNEKLHLIANYKYDKYQRKGSVFKDESQSIYRFGSIYLPTQNLGLKAFYTKSYIPPTFYNADFADKTKPPIKTQIYKYYTIEGAYTFGNSKFNIDYYNVHIDDFIYYTPVGFINIDQKVKTNGFIFDYEYSFDQNNELKLNYHFSRLNQTKNNSSEGGYIKYMGKYKQYEYFTSFIYKGGYSYYDASVPKSYDLNLGLRYNYTKDLSFSIKANNLLDKSTHSLGMDASSGLNKTTNPSFEDRGRSVSFGLRWVF